MKKTLVMKFGGAALSDSRSFAKIAERVAARQTQYKSIAVVVSAMGDTTNKLIALAKEVHPTPPRREYDMLVTVGERISIALLAMALSLIEKEAWSFTGSQSGIVTCSTHAEARIIEVRPHRLWPHLEAGRIIIVAGFQGVSQEGGITTLGRGGGDISAVALGAALSADIIEFYKDVSGVYTDDPKINPLASHIQQMNYQEAVTIANRGCKVLHPRAIQLAEKNALPLRVLSFNDANSEGINTLIHDPCLIRPVCPIYE